MAFRKKFSRTRKTSRLETRSHASRAYKHVVRQWQMSLNIKCQEVQAEPGNACPNGGVLGIWHLGDMLGPTPTPLAPKFADAVRIKHIQGVIYWHPGQLDAVDCVDGVGQLADDVTYMRVGLKKVEAPEVLSGVSPGWNPLSNGASPADLSDYVDGRWMRLWEHVFEPRVSLGFQTFQNNAASCCGKQDGYVVPPIAEGNQIGYDVPPVVCSPCDNEVEPEVNLCNVTAVVPPIWAMKINIRRTLVIKEAESLNLYFGWERMKAVNDPARLAQQPMTFFGGIRLLVES